MLKSELHTPFGQVLCTLTSKMPIVIETVRTAQRVEPVLPDGQRIDSCLITSLNCRLKSGDSVILSLRSSLHDGFEADFATGEYLDAIEVSGHDLSAAFGMRDAEWFSHISAVEIHPLQSNSEFKVELTAKQACEFEIEFATAWTLSPKNEPEEIAPWFAIDLAMKS